MKKIAFFTNHNEKLVRYVFIYKFSLIFYGMYDGYFYIYSSLIYYILLHVNCIFLLIFEHQFSKFY